MIALLRRSGPLALLSAAILALEVFTTRLLSYALHDWLLYVVLGVALLGLGAAGTLAALRPGWREPPVLPRALAWSAAATGASVVLGYAAFVRLLPDDPHGLLGLRTLAATTLLAAPFLCGGLSVTLALTGAGTRPAGTYAANVVGSGIGGALPAILLGPLDGGRLLALVCVLAGVAAAAWARPITDPWPRRAAAATIGLGIVSGIAAPVVFPIPADPTGSAQVIARFAAQRGIEVRRAFDRWDPTGRVEVMAFDRVPPDLDPSDPHPVMFYVQDASAGSLLVRWDGSDAAATAQPPRGPGTEVARNCTETLWGQGYERPRRRVLVVGLGGGPDVQCALYHRADVVDVVEINRHSIELVRGPFDEWLGGIGHDPRVRYHLVDGRSFVHGAALGTYDLVQLTGVDTKHLLPAGAMAINENPLYTREAFDDYLRALGPDGTLSIIRFSEVEMIRFANTAIESLARLGAEHPEQHIVILRSGPLLYGILVGRAPFDAAALRRLRLHVSPIDFEGLRVFVYEIFGGRTHERPSIVHQPGGPSLPVFAELFAQHAAGDISAFAAAYPANIAPASDDRPFFFDLTRYDLPSAWTQPHLRLLGGLSLSVLGGAIVLILAPLAVRSWRRRERPRGRAAAIAPVFFTAIGLGYLWIEVWLIHRLSMYLGHQTYAMSLVLGILLISSGIGAMVGERWLPVPRRRILAGTLGLAFAAAAVVVGGSPLLEATWSESLAPRVAVALALIFPVGCCLGFPMPAGLTWVAGRHPGAVAWCIGINAFASVVATVVATPLTLLAGYGAALTAGLSAYALASAAALAMSERLDARE